MANHNSKGRKILSTHYFLYFGVLGVFLPYFNLYCYHLGFDGVQIGVMSGVRQAAVVFLPLAWGILADRTNRRKQLFVFCNIASAALFSLFFLSDEFLPMLAVTVLYSLFYTPIIAFLEAFAMEILGPERNHYGRVRVWGTIAFVFMALVLGQLVDVWGIKIILTLILGGSAIQALASFTMPASPPRSRKRFHVGAAYFFKKEVVVFQFCAFLMLASHGAYYGFFSIHMENLGYSPTFTGAMWALASIAEIGVMLWSAPILGRFRPRPVLVFSLCAAVIRWIITAYVTSPAAICGVQALHAATYGTFHIASIIYIEHLIPPEARTMGQAVNNSMTYGLGLMAGFLASGYVFDHMSAKTAFAASAGVAAMGAIMLGLYRAKKPSREKG